MLVLKLILRRICSGLADRFFFRLRYLVGFLFVMALLWLLKIALPWLIDTNYWDSLRSDQLRKRDEQTDGFRSTGS